MELPKQMREHRERLGLSQEDVAHAIYISRQTISSWENGKTYPDVQSLLLLSNLFGVSIDDLVKGDVVSMTDTINKDAMKMERLIAASLLLLLMGVGCMVGLFAVWREPSIIPHMSMGALVGIAAFVALWASALVCASQVERIKRDHDLVTYKEIRAFMDGEEAPRSAGAMSRRHPGFGFAMKIALGAGIGLMIAFVFTIVVNALH